jgi:polyisoprenoid-binding protein YceI
MIAQKGADMTETSTATDTSTIGLERGIWTLDPVHTEIAFTAKHLMVARVRGQFRQFDGTITVGDTPQTSSVEVTIGAASLDTGAPDRDGHLRSADFLDVENHPNLTFRSTAVRPAGSGYELDGDLTIRGVTKPVTLAVVFEGVATDPYGNTKVGFSASTTILREDWGLTWNVALEPGGWLVSKDVKIDIVAELIKT